MPAATENSARVTTYWGNTAVEICDSTWGNGDTFVSQFASVLASWFSPTTNASCGTTQSSKTVTAASGGTLTGKLFVLADET
jgi:hypothetical protein